MALNEVDTPALLLDLDAFDSNLQRLARSGRCVLSESHRS
jgi:D-serine deaminase-like pyridoxal phosphate-dependent protein